MGKILLICFIVTVVFICGYIFFGGKKKKKKNKKEEPTQEKKIEKAIKTGKEEKEEPKKQESEEQKKVQAPEEDKQKGFKIIRKKSEVKINKKALKSGSRNPSVTRVFDKNGVRVDEVEEKEPEINPEELERTIKNIEPREIERFGTREINYDVVNNGKEFSIINPIGSPNRAPVIHDRTNFASHLNISEDGNLSGVVGTGINKVVEKIERQADGIDDSSEQMVNNVKRNFLGIEDDIDPFNFFNRGKQKVEEKKESPLKKIDAKTLIIADAVSNPKYKKNKK